MMFQIMYSDSEGRKFATERLDKVQCEHFCNCLRNAGISYEIANREDKQHLACKVVFNLMDIADKNKVYTFVDESNSSKPGDVVEVSCVDWRRKNALIINTELKTTDELIEFCKEIGYEKLGRVNKLVWRK